MISDETHTGYNHHKITEIGRTGCAYRENRREASPGRQERTTNRTTIFTPIPARAGQDAARSTRKMSQNQMKKRLRQKRRLRQQGVEQAVTQIAARGAQIQVRRALDSLLRNDFAGEDYRSVPDASLLSFGQFFEVGFTLGPAATSRHGLFPAGFRARRSEDRRWGRTD